MTTENLLSRLEGAKRTGPGKWLAKCPAHHDRAPSLTIRATDDGKTLVHCFAGCSVADVLAAVGLQLNDLFPPLPDAYGKKSTRPKYNAYELLPLVLRESTIIGIACLDLMRGIGLSPDDHYRVNSALITLRNIRLEVGQ